jgi:hypothetical protein
MTKQCGLVFICLATLVLAAPASAEWPTLHRDNQRSGYTDEIVHGPYQRKAHEMTSPVVVRSPRLVAWERAWGKQTQIPSPPKCCRHEETTVCGHIAGNTLRERETKTSPLSFFDTRRRHESLSVR